MTDAMHDKEDVNFDHKSQVDTTYSNKSDVLDSYDVLKDSGLPKNDAIHALSVEMVKIWSKADYPPIHRSRVQEKISKLIKERHQAKCRPVRAFR